MSYKQEIEKQLKGVPRELCVAFAARSALRVLPLLAANEKESHAFWYWQDHDKAKHLLAILTASRFSLGYSIVDKLSITVAYTAKAAADAADDADAYAACVADAAAADAVANAVANAAYAADDTVYGAFYGAVYAAGAAAEAASANLSHYFKNGIQYDLDILSSNPDAYEYLNKPLWTQGIQKEWDIIWQRFQNWTKELDAGFEIWLDWYQELLDGKSIDLMLLEKQLNIPVEIKGQGPKGVNAYLATLASASKQEKPLQPLNLVRAIFIGNGAAGKTSLIKALNGEPVIEGKEKMTPGIDIREWPVGDTDITAHFWDFGGQVMAHSTHQFFLRERCLYILVLDARTEFNANEQAEYWLEHIKTFGKNAPVMLVGNKSDLAQVNLDMYSLKEKYPNIIDFYPLSCIKNSGAFKSRFDAFKGELIQQLQEVGTHQVYFTAQQFKVMQKLRKRAKKKAFLKQQKFELFCSEQEISDKGEQNREWLLDLLDKLGIVIHFPQLPRLDSFILNPRWLTYGIYTLLYSEQAQDSSGILSEVTVINVLKAKQLDDGQGNSLDYSADNCGFIIDAMEEFKLCFRLPADRKQIIIPDLLPSNQPQQGFVKQQPGTLTFEFAFRGFLPRHVMPTFIVSRYDEIKGNIVWQQGVLLHSEHYETDALVQVDYHNRTLSIWLQGGQASRFFTVLRDEIISILQRMADLQYQEWLWLTDDMLLKSNNLEQPGLDLIMPNKEQSRASFKQLLALEKAGQTQYISEAGIYDLSKVLQVMPEKLRENVASQSGDGRAVNKPSQAVKIFISYSHKNDEQHKDDLVITLKGIKREYPQLEWWHDRKLVAGDWEKQIIGELEQVDIVVLLISRYFMASDYCFNNEMEVALSQHRNKGHLVIPIIVSETPSWNKHEMGKQQALPRDAQPLDKWENPEQFWGDVQRGLERELESLLVNRNDK